jgi:predicted membrane-bound spermidine synthase
LQAIRILSLVFFLSGFTALIYQVAWQRLLTVYYGVGTISITLIVSVYMAGLGLGALCGGQISERITKRLELYCLVEFLLGVFGVASPLLLDALGISTAGSSYVLSCLYVSLYLLFPTVLMGMTLPLLTKIFNQYIQNFFRTVSYLYFVNTIGAALGAFTASYVLVSFWGLDTAVYFAAGLNFLMAGCIRAAKKFSVRPSQEKTNISRIMAGSITPAWGKMAYLWVFVTGFMAIGYELIWIRITSFLVKDSPYAFSSALSVYLLGIALGSFFMNRYLHKKPTIDQGKLFFKIQFLIGISVALIFISYYYATKMTPLRELTLLSFQSDVHPLWISWRYFITPLDALPKQLYLCLDVFLWPFFFEFVPTLFMGATFPLIASLALWKQDKEGQSIGKVYFFNIMGSVLGGIVTGFVLFPVLGTELLVLVFCLIGISLGIFALRHNTVRKFATARYLLIVLLVVIVFLVFPKQGKLYSVMYFAKEKGMDFYFEEGVEGVVGTFQKGENIHNFIHGVSHGGRYPGNVFYYQVVEAMRLSRNVNNILIIGYGTGSTVEAVLKLDEVKRVTVVEINRTLIKNLCKMALFDHMLADPRIHLVFDDGRRFLLQSKEKYDLILTDPLLVTTVYSNNLHSKQFFELVRDHLAPNGVFSMWANEREIIVRTLTSVFAPVQVHSSLFFAATEPFYADNQRSEKLIYALWPDSPQHFYELQKIEAFRYLFTTQKIRSDWRMVNSDWRPGVEYFLGLGNKYEALSGETLF